MQSYFPFSEIMYCCCCEEEKKIKKKMSEPKLDADKSTADHC